MKPIIPIKTPTAQELCIDGAYEGQRLDNFLLRELRGAPRTLIYRIIRSGEVRLNGKRVQAETRVRGQDVLRIPPLRLAATALNVERQRHAPAGHFEILHEDAYFLAINKPAGVAVHGGSGVAYGVIEQVRSSRAQDESLERLELVHRLDRETSGILLIAKRHAALRKLQADFRERRVHKQYLVLVQGDWPKERKGIDLPLVKYLDAQGERRVRVVAKDDPNGMTALTLVQKIGSFYLEDAGVCSLLAVRIKTGRTHQIRVHLSALGMAILGDEKYGDFGLNKKLRSHLPRMFLHAWRLQFQHPYSQEPVDLHAALPNELQAVLPTELRQAVQTQRLH